MNCKPGDLAIILKALGSERGTGANIGRLCKVDYAFGMKDTLLGPLFHWHITMVGSPGRRSDGCFSTGGVFPDKYLLPIRPLSEPESVERKEEMSA